MSKPLLAVVAVGCIECGVPTELVGIYATQEDAETAEADYLKGGDSWARHGGEGFTMIYEAELG